MVSTARTSERQTQTSWSGADFAAVVNTLFILFVTSSSAGIKNKPGRVSNKL
jgi:hypothetical protein